MNKKNLLYGIVTLIIVAFIIGVILIASHESTKVTAGTIPNTPPSTFTALAATESIALGQIGNNVTEAEVKQNISTGSTTVCALQSPFNATTTIQSTNMNFTTATSSTIIWVLASSTAQYATSSLIETQTIGANNLGTIAFDGGSSNNVMGPLQWLVYGANGAPASTAGITGIAGTCSAIFQTL